MQQEKFIISGSPKSFAWFAHGYFEGKSADVSPVRFIVSFPTALSNLSDEDSVLIYIVRGRYRVLEENEVIGKVRGIHLPSNRTLLRFHYEEAFKDECVDIWNELRAELESQGWKFYSEESKHQPSKKPWVDDEKLSRLVMAQKGENIRAEQPDKYWKEIIKEVGFQAGGNLASRQSLFRSARQELERIHIEGNHELIAEINRRVRDEDEETKNSE